jgi:hypothetical protein
MRKSSSATDEKMRLPSLSVAEPSAGTPSGGRDADAASTPSRYTFVTLLFDPPPPPPLNATATWCHATLAGSSAGAVSAGMAKTRWRSSTAKSAPVTGLTATDQNSGESTVEYTSVVVSPRDTTRMP